MGADACIVIESTRKIEGKELKHLNYRFMDACSLGYGKKPILDPYKIGNSKNWFYSLDTLSRYYGEGYARGTWPNIYTAILWLKHNLGDAGIYYYSDYCDVEDDYFVAQNRLTNEELENIQKYWLENGGLTYRTKGSEYKRECDNCEVEMDQYMWGGGENDLKGAGLYCQGCGRREVTKDGGLTWEIIKEYER